MGLLLGMSGGVQFLCSSVAFHLSRAKLLLMRVSKEGVKIRTNFFSSVSGSKFLKACYERYFARIRSLPCDGWSFGSHDFQLVNTS